jgi:hypothetical protein
MAFDVLEEKSRASSAHLADTVGDFGDFEDGVDFGADLFQFTSAVERSDPGAQIIVGQRFLRLGNVRLYGLT